MESNKTRVTKDNQACGTYVALERRDLLIKVLSRSKFFSIQADGSTDSGNIEEELFLALYLDRSAVNKRVHIRNPFFAVCKLRRLW